MKEEAKAIVVFDVCDTLYYSNTTFDFIYFFLKHQLDSEKLQRFKHNLNRTGFIFWIDVIIGKLLRRDICKSKAVFLLKGYSKDELYKSAIMFVETLNKTSKIRETNVLLQEYMNKGYEVILCSSSIDPVIDSVSKQYNTNYVCSDLEYDVKGFCTGKIKKDISGDKQFFLNLFFEGLKREIYAVVSDNRSDKTLFKHATKKHIVIYNDKDRSHWNGIDGSFILLKKTPYSYE